MTPTTSAHRLAPPHVGLVFEPVLGHLTHAQNLRELIGRQRRIDPSFYFVPFDVTGLATYLPTYRSNWSLRAGVRTRRALQSIQGAAVLDALFVHTQVPAVLSPDVLRRIPTVVSVDATPRQYDELGLQYEHAVSGSLVEGAKWRLNATCFARAHHVVAWSAWARDGLVRDYGVPAGKVTVLAPGVRLERWTPPAVDRRPADETVRILFVGGDLERKGGRLLLKAVSALRQRAGAAAAVELHLVTKTEIDSEPGVVVHTGLTPNSDDLLDLYRSSDVFCLPTLGDCLPMVLAEAGAVGLPLVATDVGGIREIVQDDRTGYLVPVGDSEALTDRLHRLVTDEQLRRRLGRGAQTVVRSEHDAARNADTLVELLRDAACAGRQKRAS
jgi:glycosyltransferase involved in cell wall biosynthesis